MQRVRILCLEHWTSDRTVNGHWTHAKLFVLRGGYHLHFTQEGEWFPRGQGVCTVTPQGSSCHLSMKGKSNMINNRILY